MRALCFVVLLLLTASALAETCTQPGATGQKDAVPLCAVVMQVEQALEAYAATSGKGDNALPPLREADFDFKTAASTTGGAKIGLIVFTLGGSHEKDATSEVEIHYAAPKPKVGLGPHAQPALKDQLYNTIMGAAEQIRMARRVGDLPLSRLDVMLQFGVKWDANAGVNVPVSLVTIGVNGDRNRNSVQTVKLTFAP